MDGELKPRAKRRTSWSKERKQKGFESRGSYFGRLAEAARVNIKDSRPFFVFFAERWRHSPPRGAANQGAKIGILGFPISLSCMTSLPAFSRPLTARPLGFSIGSVLSL